MGFNKGKGIWDWFVEYGKEELQDQEKIKGGANQLATAAAIADKDSVEKLKKLQKKAV